MRIVIINASARKNGATAKILNEFADNLSAKDDVDIISVNLSDLNLNFCLGCCQCYKNGVCIIEDDADALSETISGADGVIIGTPTNASSISGQLKTFIDRGHFVIEQLLKNKHTIGVVTYENAGGGSALKALKKLFVFSGARTFGRLIVKLPFNSNPLNILNLKNRIKSKSDRFHNAILINKAPSVLFMIIHFIVFRFGIKPFVIKKGEEYVGVIKHWEKRNIKT